MRAPSPAGAPKPPAAFLAVVRQHFARITNSGRLIPEIDGLRFLAIGGVVLYHAMQQVAVRNGGSAEFTAYQGGDRALVWLLTQGRLGVEFFFVISGLVLGLQFAERAHTGRPLPEVKPFYLRRLTRLEPPYVVNLGLSCVLVAVLFHAGLRPKGAGLGALWPHLAASLFYLHSAVFHEASPVNGVTWSLEIEAQFYLLMPLLGGLLFRIRSAGVRAGLLGAAILAQAGIGWGSRDPAWYWQLSLAGFFGYFLMGILLADLESARRSRGAGGHLAWDGAALGAAAALLLSEAYLHYEGYFPWLFGVICLAAFRGRILKRFLNLSPVWMVGGMCYSIYLYHLWVLGIGAQALRWAFRPEAAFWVNFLLITPVLLAAVLAVCAGFYVVLERPCMPRDWPGRLWAKWAGGWGQPGPARESGRRS